MNNIIKKITIEFECESCRHLNKIEISKEEFILDYLYANQYETLLNLDCEKCYYINDVELI